MKWLERIEKIQASKNGEFRKNPNHRNIDLLKNLYGQEIEFWKELFESCSLGVLDSSELAAIIEFTQIDKIRNKIVDELGLSSSAFWTAFKQGDQKSMQRFHALLNDIWSDGIITPVEKLKIKDFIANKEISFKEALKIQHEYRIKYASQDLENIMDGYGDLILGKSLTEITAMLFEDYNISPLTVDIQKIITFIAKHQQNLSEEKGDENPLKINVKYTKYDWSWIPIEAMDTSESLMDQNSALKEIYFAPILETSIGDTDFFLKLTYLSAIDVNANGRRFLRSYVKYSRHLN